MATAYLWLYVTENALRTLIRQVFCSEDNWWEVRVNPTIKKDVAVTKSKDPYDGAVRKDELEYTHLGQIKEIIIASNNWTLFVPFLREKDKRSFQVMVDKAIPYRNAIAHCTPLTDVDLRIVNLRFKDILDMLKD